MNKRLLKDIEFLIELDKMKTVLRKTRVIGQDEFEDDAQHSWHVAMMATILEEYSDLELDMEKVVKMLLIHDIVEIYAGDTFAYDIEGYKDKKEREEKSAREIFGFLDRDKSQELKKIWEEFEEVKTNEALFATAMDRMQPILVNYKNKGGTWPEHNIRKEDVMKRIEPIKDVSLELWKFTMGILEKSQDKGYLI